MSFKVQARMGGHREILRALDALGAKVKNKLVKQAAQAAGRVLLAEAKRRVPVELGILKRSLGQKVVLYQRAAVAILGPRHGFRVQAIRRRGKWAPAPPPPSGFANPVNYTHLVELGTYRSRARSFLQTTMAAKRKEASDKAAAVLASGLGG